jgi:hypothetical protein
MSAGEVRLAIANLIAQLRGDSSVNRTAVGVSHVLSLPSTATLDSLKGTISNWGETQIRVHIQDDESTLIWVDVSALPPSSGLDSQTLELQSLVAREGGRYLGLDDRYTYAGPTEPSQQICSESAE